MRTIISLGVLGSLIVVLMAYPEIIYIALAVKSSFIYALGLIYSPLTIFILFFEVAWLVAVNFIRKL